MKLKIRIGIFTSVVIIIVFILMYAVYKCIFNYHPAFGHLILYEETVRPVDDVAALKENIRQDYVKLNNRRNRRKAKITPMVYGDSNQAAEVIDDDANDAFLNGVSFPTRNLGPISASDSFPRSKLVQDCLKRERKLISEDNRHQFEELVQLSQEMQASSLFNSGILQPRITIKQLQKSRDTLKVTKRFQNKISNQDLYEENDPDVDAVLEAMATMKINNVEEVLRGTQLKLIVTFEDGSKAMLKPMRFDRDKETNPNHFYFSDFERHTSEIAAFHLDRILGFRRCPPVIGRKVNVKTELFDNTQNEFKKTFFVSPDDNICFHGHCKQYCDTSHAFCGQPVLVEVSLAAMLNPERKKWPSPWKRTYKKRNPKAEWEKNNSYCHGVRQQAPFKNTKRLADLMDTIILDFLIGNMDRHSFETFAIFGNNSLILHLDQGRGFGRASHDELSILTPLKQCCYLHPKTFYRLLELQHSDLKLSSEMRCSLYRDPVNPVLTKAHLEALDRRLQIILHTVEDCIQKHGMNNVFYQ